MTSELKLEKLLSCRRDPSCLGIVLARLNAYLLDSFQLENYFVSLGSLGFCGDDDFEQVWKDEYVMDYLLSTIKIVTIIRSTADSAGILRTVSR